MHRDVHRGVAEQLPQQAETCADGDEREVQTLHGAARDGGQPKQNGADDDVDPGNYPRRGRGAYAERGNGEKEA